MKLLLRKAVGSDKSQSEREASWAANGKAILVGVGLPKPFRARIKPT
jgi:hypothetical protein